VQTEPFLKLNHIFWHGRTPPRYSVGSIMQAPQAQ
jgi:hypothetical protein